jgi:hypothetical protein
LEKLLAQVAERQFRGIYRLFLTLASPKTVLKKAGQIWSQFYNQGKLVAESTGPKTALLRLSDFKDLPLDHERIYLPYLIKILELTGAKNVKAVHRYCLARKDPQCVTEISWD